MDIFNTIIDSMNKEKAVVQSIVEAAEEAVRSGPSNMRIGLTEKIDYSNNITVSKGNIVLDVDEKTVYVATGEYKGDEPIVASAVGATKSIQPELVIVGHHASTPAVRKAVDRLAVKYPDRRILVYGDLPMKDTMESADTTKGASVHNDSDPWGTWMKAGDKKNDAAEKDTATKKKVPVKKKGKK
jgi:hypothetical protein